MLSSFGSRAIALKELANMRLYTSKNLIIKIMAQKPTSNIFTHFEKVKYPRLNRNKKHTLSDIFFMTLSAVICGADNWVMIQEFCKSKEA